MYAQIKAELILPACLVVITARCAKYTQIALARSSAELTALIMAEQEVVFVDRPAAAARVISRLRLKPG